MGGLIKESSEGIVKIHLHGRLGLIKIPERLIIREEPVAAAHETEFYFSYVQITEEPLDYDDLDMTPDHEPEPCLLGGSITEVNDTAIEVAIMNDLGTIAVLSIARQQGAPRITAPHVPISYRTRKYVRYGHVPV